jgi:hypothetical protein
MLTCKKILQAALSFYRETRMIVRANGVFIFYGRPKRRLACTIAAYYDLAFKIGFDPACSRVRRLASQVYSFWPSITFWLVKSFIGNPMIRIIRSV